MINTVGHERHVPRPFDGICKLSLVSGGSSRYSARDDLAPLAHHVLQVSHILVININNAFRRKPADLFSYVSLFLFLFLAKTPWNDGHAFLRILFSTVTA
jgi:hypothetical protein